MNVNKPLTRAAYFQGRNLNPIPTDLVPVTIRGAYREDQWAVCLGHVPRESLSYLNTLCNRNMDWCYGDDEMLADVDENGEFIAWAQDAEQAAWYGAILSSLISVVNSGLL
jgi:hypothetical protein